MLLAFAALRAVWREYRASGIWEKTAHSTSPPAPAHRCPDEAPHDRDELGSAPRHARAAGSAADLAVGAPGHADLPLPPLGLLVLVRRRPAVNLTGAPQRIDDEGTYVAQAYALLQYGELAHYTYWYDHPPLGWIQLAGWFLLTGGPDSASSAVAAGRGFMVVVAMITAALLWTLARRLGLSLAAATAAVAVFALSPLAVDLGRTVYLDNIATAWLLAALVLFSSPQQRLSRRRSVVQRATASRY